MLRILGSTWTKCSGTRIEHDAGRQTRGFFALLRVAFNGVDRQRLDEIGPDRLCAEWVVKNGGAVQFVNQSRLVRDYNLLLANTATASPKLQIIDATDSSIMAIGFEHFHGCKSIERIILRRCQHMENEALQHLAYVKDTLKHLEIVDCHNVEDSGLLTLKQLQHLQTLTMHGFVFVEALDSVVHQLKQDLPNCQITTQPAKHDSPTAE